MRIAFILPSLANTGPCIVAKDLCDGLTAAGHECKVFYFDDITELDMPCQTQRIKMWQGIDFGSWDVVHSHMLRPDGYVWWHRLFKARRGCTLFITTLHNPVTAKDATLSRTKAFVQNIMWKTFLTTHDYVVTLSDYAAGTLHGVGRKKIRVIYNGRDIDVKEDIADIADRERIDSLRASYRVIGTVSGISTRKSLDQMVRALPLLTGYAFVAVGDGPQLEGLKVLAKELSVDDRCLWVGYKPNAVDYYSKFDIFVMCSISEGFPLALIEASAYSLPTVLSDIGVLKSVIGDNEVCFYPLFDIKALSGAIKKVDDDRERYSKAIHEYYRNNLTRDIMVSHYIGLYSTNHNK